MSGQREVTLLTSNLVGAGKERWLVHVELDLVPGYTFTIRTNQAKLDRVGPVRRKMRIYECRYKG